MNYFSQYRKINDRCYLIKIIERETEDFDSTYEISISQEIYEHLKDKIKINIFNNFSTTRYYVLSSTTSSEITSVDDILYDDTQITNTEEIDKIKQSYVTTITQNFLPKIYNMIPNIINVIFTNNQILLANNYIITEENKEEKINEIILENDEKNIDALMNLTSKMEEYNKIISILEQSTTVLNTISQSSDLDEIENITQELLKLLDSDNAI